LNKKTLLFPQGGLPIRRDKLMVFEKKVQQHLLVAAATVDPSPAFQSREIDYVVFSVAERRLIPIIGINRRSATEGGNA